MLEAMNYAVLFCKDTDACRAWYEKAGFVYRHGYEGMHWLGVGDDQVMLHPAEESSGGSGLCLHVAVGDVDAHFRHVVEQGLAPYDHQQPGKALDGPVVREWGAREFEMNDPEGHRWAFTQST